MTMMLSADDVTSRFDNVFWLGDLNSRMQKDRDQVQTMLGVPQDDDEEPSSQQRSSFEDVLQHDELRRVIDDGKSVDTSVIFIVNRSIRPE